MARAVSGVRPAAGSSNSRSRTACTMVPRAASGVGGSGRPAPRSIDEVAGIAPEQDRQQAQQQGDPPTPDARRGSKYGIVIARPFGVPVYVSPYWFLVAGLFVLFYASSLPSTVHPAAVRYLVAAAFVILLYASVLVPELSHCVVARAFRLAVRPIPLYPPRGFSEIEQEPPTPAKEFLVSVAGPLTSLALAGCGFGLNLALNPSGIPRVLIDQLILANLLVGIFNLLPDQHAGNAAG